MITISITELKRNYFHYIGLIESNEVDEITITKYNRPVASIVPKKKSLIGALEHLGIKECHVDGPEFDEIIKEFEY